VQRTYRLIEDLQAEQHAEAFDSAFRDYLDEDFELSPPAVYPEGEQLFKGREGLERWIASTAEVWDEWRFEPERFVEADDQVLALVRLMARGSASGVRLDRDTAHVWTVRDGRVTRCDVYLDRSEALEALGLPSARIAS
jgi:ketosteroid isomerase-like protein